MLPQEYVYEFNDFRVEPKGEIIRKDGTPMRLAPKDFDLLLLLLGNAGRVVSKEEIMKKVWKDSFVEESNITEHIKILRREFGRDVIQNIPKRGYKFVSEVTKTPKEIEFESEITLLQKPAKQKNYKSRYILVGLICTFFIVGVYFIFFNKQNADSSSTQKTIFEDDFSGNEFDLQKWMPKRKSVRISEGKAVITMDEMDNGGRLWSSYFPYDPTKPIVATSRLKVHPNKNNDEYNFLGEFFLIPKVFQDDQSEENELDVLKTGLVDVDTLKSGVLGFGLMYMKSEHKDENQVPVEGFYMIKPGGRPSSTYAQKHNLISPPIAPIWDNWFEQKIIYNPTTGLIEYFIDNEKKGEFIIGEMSKLKEYKMQLLIEPYGWYTGHSMEIDWIKITQ
jgi:DNA-binding winged helix-turn-helix (wHTH) protein